MRFVDTNVLLYALSTEDSERDKADLANQILKARDLGVSVQVLQEFYVQATRASRRDRLSHELAVGLIESFSRFPIQEITTGVLMAALDTCRRFGLSYWDAAILEAARALGCEVVLSEDMSNDEDYDGVHVENPFRTI